MAGIRKHTQNVVIDLISFACMILLMGTGVILYFVLPPGSHGEAFLGLSRHQWGDVHFWIAIAFVVIITVHLILHTSWIKASFFSPSKR